MEMPTLGWGMIALLLFLSWGVCALRAGGRFKERIPASVPNMKLLQVASPMLYLLEEIRWIERIPAIFYRIQRAMQVLYGSQVSALYSTLFMAEILNYAFFMLIFACLLPMLTDGGLAGFGVGLMLAVLLPLAQLKELDKRVKNREHEILLELPEFLNQMILLVDAGETVQRALTLCVDRKRSQTSHPLYKELIQMIHEWSGGYSFQQSFEQFSKRCALQEVSIFTTTIMLNYRRGGGEFVVALRDLSRILWEKRKAVSRVRGEEASSKLVFPMVVVFFLLLVLVCTPIFMMMSA